LGSDVFAHTQSSYGSSAITITVPSGSSSEYTSAWGVPAATAAEGNTSKYGSSHNAISIVES
jgi:hypothetical protein